MSKATAGIVINPQSDDRFGFLNDCTIVANPREQPYLLYPSGRKLSLGDICEEMQEVLVQPQRIFFSNGSMSD